MRMNQPASLQAPASTPGTSVSPNTLRRLLRSGDWEEIGTACAALGLEYAADMIDEGDYAEALEAIHRGLYARDWGGGFPFFNAIPDRTDFLEVLPHQLNVLVSACRLQGDRGGPIWRSIHLANSVFLDSGAITMLKLCANRKAKPQEVHGWLKSQHLLPQLAWRLYEQGVSQGVAAMMDCPMEPWLLQAVGITPDEALKITAANACSWYNDVTLPPGWRKVYVLQGWLPEEYNRSMHQLSWFPAWLEIAQGEAWAAVGTTCMRKPPGLYSVYEVARQLLGPDAHIHALGIARPSWIGELYHDGLIDSADSATASMQVAYNKGPVRVHGQRGHLLPELFARNMARMDADVLAAVKSPPRERRRHRQQEIGGLAYEPEVYV